MGTEALDRAAVILAEALALERELRSKAAEIQESLTLAEARVQEARVRLYRLSQPSTESAVEGGARALKFGQRVRTCFALFERSGWQHLAVPSIVPTFQQLGLLGGDSAHDPLRAAETVRQFLMLLEKKELVCRTPRGWWGATAKGIELHKRGLAEQLFGTKDFSAAE